jgi:hypothetical protein
MDKYTDTNFRIKRYINARIKGKSLLAQKIIVFKLLFSVNCDDRSRKSKCKYLLAKNKEDFG